MVSNNARDIDYLFHKLKIISWPRKHVKVEDSEDYSRSLAKLVDNLDSEEPEYADEILDMVSDSKSKSKPQSVIQVGNSFDVTSLLSSSSSCRESYLVRNDDGERIGVNEETFKGKHVLVCCFYVPMLHDSAYVRCVQALATTCRDLYYSSSSTRVIDFDFEMIVVAKMNRLADYEFVFDRFLSGFPGRCLAIPFKDSRRRDYVCKYLDLIDSNRCFPCLLLDDKGVVLPFDPRSLLEYGIEAFPFDNNNNNNLGQDHQPEHQWPRLKGLLDTYTPFSGPKLEEFLRCSPSHVLYKVYRASGSRKKVTVSKLSERVVGVYLCTHGHLIPTIHKVHKQCKTRRLELEILVVYLPFVSSCDPRVFEEYINKQLRKQKVSWWRFPFNNFVCRRFWRLTSGYPGDRLLIVGPHGKYVDLYGGGVMENYGIDAYPFTRETILQGELNKAMALTLDSLAYESRYHVVKGNDKRITVLLDELKGKNVFLYFSCFDNIDEIKSRYYDELVSWYYAIKAKVPNFEVVFVALDDTNTEIGAKQRAKILSTMPWLVCPWDPNHSASLYTFIGDVAYNCFLGLGKDGRACTIRHPAAVTSIGPDDFPLKDHLREDFIEQFNDIDLGLYDM